MKYIEVNYKRQRQEKSIKRKTRESRRLGKSSEKNFVLAEKDERLRGERKN